MTEYYSSTFSHGDGSKIDETLVAGIAMGFPGISIALGNISDLLWVGAAGYEDIGSKTPVNVNSGFGIGSITKTFVAVVVFQLVEEGKLDLDYPVTAYVKEPIVQHIPNANKATLRQLLNHTSGIPTWEFHPTWIRRGRGDEIVANYIWGKTETLDYVANDKSKAEYIPGTTYAYSNTNYTLLGLVIEAVTDNELTAEIRHRILELLGMNNTFMDSFEKSSTSIVHSYHYATPTFARDAGVHKLFSKIGPYVVETTSANLSPEWAAGGMISTPTDLVRFAQGLRDGRLLSSALQREMFRYIPSANSTGSEYMQGILRLPNIYNSLSLIGHAGGTLGFSSAMYWFEEIDLIVSATINIGSMHSGLNPTLFSLYFKHILLPAIVEYEKTTH